MKTRQELEQWGLVTPSCSLFSKNIMGVLSVWICMHMPACVLVMLINHFDVYPHFCVLVWSDLWQCLTEVRASADRLLGFWSTDFICIAQMHCIAWKFKRTVFSAFTQLCRVTTMRRYLIGIYTNSHSEHKWTHMHISTLKSLSLCMVTSTKTILNKNKLYRWFPSSSSNILFFFSRQNTLPDTAF